MLQLNQYTTNVTEHNFMWLEFSWNKPELLQTAIPVRQLTQSCKWERAIVRQISKWTNRHTQTQLFSYVVHFLHMPNALPAQCDYTRHIYQLNVDNTYCQKTANLLYNIMTNLKSSKCYYNPCVITWVRTRTVPNLLTRRERLPKVLYQISTYLMEYGQTLQSILV